MFILFNSSSESEISFSEPEDDDVSPSAEYPVSVISSSQIWLNSLPEESSVKDEMKHKMTGFVYFCYLMNKNTVNLKLPTLVVPSCTLQPTVTRFTLYLVKIVYTYKEETCGPQMSTTFCYLVSCSNPFSNFLEYTKLSGTLLSVIETTVS